MVRLLVSVVAAVISVCSPADAQNLLLPERSDFAGRLVALDGEVRRAFDAALAEYDGEILARPFDVVRRVDRCRFVEEFYYNNEYVAWIDSVYEISESCRTDLESEFGNHPEVILYGFEFLYGEELLAAAGVYDQPAMRPAWTTGQLARLYTQLATAAEAVGNEFAGRYALRALELDAEADVRIIAAESLIAAGDFATAIEVLHSPMDVVAPETDPWYVVEKIRLLGLAGDRAGVDDLYRLLRSNADYYDSSTVAAALRDAGLFDLARMEFEAATENPGYLVNADLERFRFELEFGSKSQAEAAYTALRDVGWGADPLAVNRMALFMEYPSLAWQARDYLGLLAVLGVMSFIALVALIPVSVVHYRGLALRLNRQLPVATGSLRLRHAWYALFALGVASLIGLYAVGPLDLLTERETAWGLDVDSDLLAGSLLVESLSLLLLLFPLAWLIARRGPSFVAAPWSVPRAVFFALVAAAVLRLPFFILVAAQPDIPSALTDGVFLWDMLERISAQYGVLTAFWLIVVAAPVAEEFLFRQVILSAFSRHISFWAANLLQAGLFSAMHMDAVAFVYLFLMGLIAGFLARRSGGLLAPILFHACFNLLAGLVFLR